MREIAVAAGVSVMTVSLVLREQGRVSAAMRKKIKRTADRLGYRPDPALSALMTYRHERQTVRDYQTLAFVTNFSTNLGWKEEVYTRLYYQGAVDRAEKLGYHVEPFWMSQPGMTPERAAQILEARGIKGLLVAPVLVPVARLALAWDRFCAVSLCRNLASPDINVVDHNHHQSMTLAWRELRRRGYRRVGYAIKEYSEEIAGRLWLGTLLMEQQRGSAGEKAIPPLVAREWNRKSFAAWLAKHRPDVVISPDIAVHRWLGELGRKLPQDIGFVWLEAVPEEGITGVCQHFENVGIASVDLLHLELIRSAYGIPSVRQTIGIDGNWFEGRTLRPPAGG
jgi:LacI family transcriptional regulator